MSATRPPLLLEAAAFGSAGGEVLLKQTHIGWIYLVGDEAFKLKKHVKFDFLDFSTLEGRRWACEREISLNRRLCPDLYLGLLPVFEDASGHRRVERTISETSSAKAVDCAVWMRRLPEARMLDQLLIQSDVNASDAERIADTLADFYLRQRGQPLPSGDNGSLRVVTFNIEENLREGAALNPRVLSAGALKLIAFRARYFLNKYGALIEQRQCDGFVVDGHGDLRAENINLPEHGSPMLFDCIEFNDRFRIGDSALDVAYLAMDFDSRGREDLSAAFLARYAERCDANLHPKLLNFYLGYRAFVKGKVAAWIAADTNVVPAQQQTSAEQARQLFDLAVRYALRDEPALLIFCGPAGSGKSTLATRLASRLKCVHLATDLLRDELVPRGAPVEQRYAGHISGRVYDILCERAAQALSQKQTVILDGTFTTPARRKQAASIAENACVPAILIWADSPAQAIEKHLTERTESGALFGSEAGLDISRKQQSTFSAPTETELRQNGGALSAICRVDTTQPLDQSHDAVWDGVLSRLGE